MTDPKPLTLAQRVRASEQRSIDAGAAIRMPGGLLPAEAAQALDALVAANWAPSRTAAIARALVEARNNHAI